MTVAKKIHPPATKADLLLRIEKLKRANAKLRAKTKILARAASEYGEAMDVLRSKQTVDVTLVSRNPSGGHRMFSGKT